MVVVGGEQEGGEVLWEKLLPGEIGNSVEKQVSGPALDRIEIQERQTTRWTVSGLINGDQPFFYLHRLVFGSTGQKTESVFFSKLKLFLFQ